MSNMQLTLADRFFESVQTLKGFHLQKTAGHTITRDAIKIHHTEGMWKGEEGRENKRGGGKKDGVKTMKWLRDFRGKQRGKE